MASATRRIVLPITHPELARALDVELPTLLLCSGPSRTGKTVCMRCLVAETGAQAFSLRISSVGSEYVTVTPRLVRDAVNMALRLAEETGRTVFLVMDDGEQLARQRGSLEHSSGWHDDLTGEILSIIDDLEQKPGRVCIFLISNCEELLDLAIVKRSVQQLRFTLPGPDEYRALWRHELCHLPDGLRPADLDALAAALVSDIYTDPSWVSGLMGQPAARMIIPAHLVDCSTPRLSLSEARGIAFEQAVRKGKAAAVDMQLLRESQLKIVVDGFRQLLKRSSGRVLSDLNLQSVQVKA
jgi:SpoVK/Ycf46/Vps4 family AAA+-type ATPase